MNMIAKHMNLWLGASKTCKESNWTHRVQQQDHHMTPLMAAVAEDSEDKVEERALVEEEALAVIIDHSHATNVEL